MKEFTGNERKRKEEHEKERILFSAFITCLFLILSYLFPSLFLTENERLEIFIMLMNLPMVLGMLFFSKKSGRIYLRYAVLEDITEENVNGIVNKAYGSFHYASETFFFIMISSAINLISGGIFAILAWFFSIFFGVNSILHLHEVRKLEKDAIENGL